MADAPLHTRKLLARQKMRNLLLRAATSRDEKKRDDEEKSLRTMLSLAEGGDTAELCALLKGKLQELEQDREEAAKEASKPTGGRTKREAWA